jgi:hypothetical protein
MVMPPPFHLADPPAEPPPGVSQPALWRLAARVFHAHGPAGFRRGLLAACRRCAEPWPCVGRQLAERVLVTALATAGPSYLAVLRGEEGLHGPTGWD